MKSEIERRLATNGSLKPRAENIIRGVRPEHFYFEAHELPNPLSAYQSSLDKIATAWLKVFPLLETLDIEVAFNQTASAGPQILDAYEALLHLLNGHIDVCEMALKSLRPPKEGKFPSHRHFLDNVKLPGWKHFKKVVLDQYRAEHVGAMVNAIKHDGAHLALCNAVARTGPICGFFIVGHHPDGALGPNRKIHKRFNGVETAFSFKRDMMVHFWWIYRVGEALAECIEAAVKADHGADVQEKGPNANGARGEWTRLCLECSALKPLFFPDEMAKPRPIIVTPKDGAAVSIKMHPPSHSLMPLTMNLKLPLVMVEGTVSYVMPYHNKASLG